jgi:hypothetical protein
MENFLTNVLYPSCAIMGILSLIVIAVNTGKNKK